MTFPLLILLPATAYLLGSIPWGWILTVLFTSRDLRRAGSGNIGATNVKRTAGVSLALITLALDMAKGAVPVLLAVRAVGIETPWPQVYVSLVCLCAFFGHLYPIYTGYKNGGKGVATLAGCFLAVSPAAFFVVLLVFVLFLCMSSRASVASLAGSAALPLVLFKTAGAGVITGCAGLAAVFVILRHRENIRRLVAGEEPRII